MQYVVGFPQLSLDMVVCLVEGKGTKANGIYLAKGVECFHPTVLVAAHFGSKEGIVRALILYHPVFVTCIIDVGGIDVDMGCGTFPYINKVCQRTR